jgi:ferrous iron transport protein B
MTQRTVTVALVGNPNTGKTTLFNALSGLRQRVGNYPGVTIEMKKGRIVLGGSTIELIDLPGTYSLAPRSPDEMVSVDLLLGHCPGEPRPDVIVTIVDASNLERHLYLTTQLLELGVPVVVALNMIDVAAKLGVEIETTRLSERLGIPIVPIRANKGVGLDALTQAILIAAGSAAPARYPVFPEPFNQAVKTLATRLNGEEPFLIQRLLLDIGGHTERRLAERHGQGLRDDVESARRRLTEAGCPIPAIEAKTRFAWIHNITKDCIRRPAKRPVTWTDRLDRFLTHRVWGTLLFMLVMLVIFQSIFSGAKPMMNLISEGIDWLGAQVTGSMPDGPLKSLIADGVVKGVGGVVVFLPQILILFGFIAILEDCGYMARAAFLMDKLMARCGLSGKSFIPLLSSMACAVPGIMATRVIENRRDRLVTIVVAPLMSCSARLPVYLLLIGTFLTIGQPWWVPGFTMFAMYAIGLVTAPIVALLIRRTFLRGEAPVFVMEMPTYKWPSIRTVVRRMLEAGWAFLRRAGTLILAATIVVWALLYFPRTAPDGVPYETRVAEAEANEDDDRANAIRGEWQRQSWLGRSGRAIAPAVRPLGWDWRLGMAAIASFPAREVIVGTLGIIYNQGDVSAEEIRESPQVAETSLGRALSDATWDDDPTRKVFTIPAALSVMVFFALCCQCVSTLAVIRRETRSWRWPVFAFTYMTFLAYAGAMIVYQLGTWFGG